MAKASNRKSKSARDPSPADLAPLTLEAPLPELPDLETLKAMSPDELDGLIDEFIAAIPFLRPDPEDLAKAQAIVDDARECKDRRKRVSMARKALKICFDCVDAYCILAEDDAVTDGQRIEHYWSAVNAGEAALGANPFGDYKGRFWSDLVTRPYMRARAGLANALREAGDIDGAIRQYQDLLKLNPGDDQRVRYLLLECYVREDRIKPLERLLRKYKTEVAAE